MTDAYIEGFCKTAEEHGVDPEALMKTAGIPSPYLLKNLAGTVMRAQTAAVAPSDVLSALRGVVRGGRFANRARSALVDNAQTALSKRLMALQGARRTLGQSFPRGIPAQYSKELDRIEGILDGHAGRLGGFKLENYHGGADANERATKLLETIRFNTPSAEQGSWFK